MTGVSDTPRAVAFIDILGMRELVRDKITGQAFSAEFIKIVTQIISRSESISNDRGEVYLSGWTKQRGIVVTSISDSIVISVPLNLKFHAKKMPPIWAVFILFQIVFWLQRALLQVGVLSRGGLTVGNLYHTREIVVGTALIDAYELESNIAIYPRAILSDQILELLLVEDIPDAFSMKDRLGSMISRDRDGFYFVDFLGLDPMEIETDWEDRVDYVLNLLQSRLDKTTNLRHRQKLTWLYEYANRMASIARDPEQANPHLTDGPFELRFPRFSHEQDAEN